MANKKHPYCTKNNNKGRALKPKALAHFVFSFVFSFTVLFMGSGCAGNYDNNDNNNNESNSISSEDSPSITEIELERAIDIVAESLIENQFGINSRDLLAMENPLGEGFFVYIEETRYFGVERIFVWVVVDGQAFKANGTTDILSPSLPFPRDGDPDVWALTNLSPFGASQFIDYIFEGYPIEAYSSPEPLITPDEGERFGYSIEERMAIYLEIVSAEDRALGENLDHDYYYYTVQDDYGLTFDEVLEIAHEGTLSFWPMPPLPTENN